MNTIALAMISRGTGQEVSNLDRALASIAPHVDGVYITLTSPKDQTQAAEEVCKKYNAHVSYTEALFTADLSMVTWLKDFFGYEPQIKASDKLFLFDQARNYNFSQVPKDYDWVIWIDTDDVFVGAENLHELGKIGLEKNIEAFYFKYIYQAEFDKNGRIKHVIIEHLRERLVRNIGVYKWVAPIHETLIEQRPTMKTDNYDCQVVHLSTQEDKLNSLTRNLKNLELAIYQSQGKDPRHIYYLAKAFYDLNTAEYNDKAIPLIMKYLGGEHPSGWPEERAQAYEYLADIYRRKGEFNNAVKAAVNAMIEQPEQPSIFLNLAHTYMVRQEWERALFWVRLASAIPEKKTTLVVNPRDTQAKTLEILYNCALNLNKVDEAWAAAAKMLEMFPEETSVQQAYTFISQLREQRDLTMKYMQLAEYLKKSGEWYKLKPLLAAAPRMIESNPFVISLNQQNNPPTPWGKDEIAIYCGIGFTPWSPKRLTDPQGCFVGGSEEAVILAAEALARKGWKVTVYNDPGTDEGEYNGVKYLPYYKFNRMDNFNILVAWRDIRFFDTEFSAKKKVLWLHDIQNPVEYTPERVQKIDKVLFLSKWHRDNVPTLPDEKVIITSNGIQL